MTSHRGSGFRGSEGARQAGMPGVEPTRHSGRPRDRADGAPCVSDGACPVNWSDRHRMGAEAHKHSAA